MSAASSGAAVTTATFGRLADGRTVDIVHLSNGGAMRAAVIGWGAALQALEVADRDGRGGDVVLGHDNLADYVRRPQFFGATIGRYANRIGGARFDLDGRTWHVSPSDGPNTLHGGARGFDRHAWEVVAAGVSGDAACVTFRRTSPDGEEGFPGTMTIDAGYTLGPGNLLRLDYVARTEAPTVVNLTNHSFFNLAGEGSGASALDHVVRIDADMFTPVDENLIPTGELRPVAGTGLDFRAPTQVASRIRDASDIQLMRARGYDFNYVLRGGVTAEPRPVARILHPGSGRVLEIATTEPGLQFYTGNFLDGTVAGKSGLAYRQGDALCFETQHFPDSPNHPEFPTTRLGAGEVFRSTTIWRFATEPSGPP